MYDKLSEKTRKEYEDIMLQFFEALLPDDYQDHIDNDESDSNTDELPF